MNRLLLRSVAFVVDGVLIFVAVLLFFLVSALCWDFFNKVTFETYQSLKAASNWHTSLIWIAIAISFGIRDGLSVPSALRLLGLRVYFPSENPAARAIAGVLRAGVFFCVPYLIMHVTPDYNLLDADSNVKVGLWIDVVAVLLIPVSIILPGRGRQGFHDLFLRAHVSLLKEMPSRPQSKSWRGWAMGLLVTLAFAAIPPILIQMAGPRTFMPFSEWVRLNYGRGKAVLSKKNDWQTRMVINLRASGMASYGSEGTNEILDANVPSEAFEALNSRLFKWNLQSKTAVDPIKLRVGLDVGPEVPAGFAYLHLRVWVSDDTFNDDIFAVMTAGTLGRSVLRGNPEFQLVRVSLERITFIGPVGVIHNSDLWMTLEDKSFRVFRPNEGWSSRQLAFFFGNPLIGIHGGS